MNATECCDAIGCNCGGTTMNDYLSSFTPVNIVIILGILAVLLFLIRFFFNATRKSDYGENSDDKR